MIVKLLTEHHLAFLSLIGGCRGSSESTLVKMSNSWKSHVTAHLLLLLLFSGSIHPDWTYFSRKFFFLGGGGFFRFFCYLYLSRDM